MRKKIILSILIVISVAINAQNLLDGPQKIIIDKERNRYLVSNFYSGGDLVQIDSLGNQSYFVENAGMVDGMQIIGDTVYGSAMGARIYGYNLNTGLKVMELNLSSEGVEFVSGFIADSAGYLYVSERFGDRIFKVDPVTRNYWVFAQGNGLDEPNGLLYEPEYDRIIVCLDKPNPPILALSMLDSTISVLTTTTINGSDGIARDALGNYYVTGYYLHAIYKFDPDFSNDPEVFYEEDYVVYPTYNEENNSLIVTLYNQDDWAEILLDPSSSGKEMNVNDQMQLNCYPNPAIDVFNIEFYLDERSDVEIVVNDQLGRKIGTLVNENRNTGNNQISWNVKDENGNNVPSGIYYLTVRINGLLKNSSTLVINNKQ